MINDHQMFLNFRLYKNEMFSIVLKFIQGYTERFYYAEASTFRLSSTVLCDPVYCECYLLDL